MVKKLKNYAILLAFILLLVVVLSTSNRISMWLIYTSFTATLVATICIIMEFLNAQQKKQNKNKNNSRR